MAEPEISLYTLAEAGAEAEEVSVSATFSADTGSVAFSYIAGVYFDADKDNGNAKNNKAYSFFISLK